VLYDDSARYFINQFKLEGGPSKTYAYVIAKVNAEATVARAGWDWRRVFTIRRILEDSVKATVAKTSMVLSAKVRGVNNKLFNPNPHIKPATKKDAEYMITDRALKAFDKSSLNPFK
jgi:hypothetical protein